jgi:hypothetical protein
VNQYLDRQEILTDGKYNLNKFDFQELYTGNPEDDQTSYVEKKIFKFKYRRALDSREDYERRNRRMIEEQKQRFQEKKHLETIQNYLKDPVAHEAAYLQLLENESVSQYKDYFRSENDEFDNVVLGLNRKKLSLAFENWQIEKQDRSTFQTFPLPQWNNDLGFWANALAVVSEVQQVGSKLEQIEAAHTTASLATSAVQETK